MHNVESIYFFILVFAVLFTIRTLLKFISALSKSTPKPFVFTDRELIILGTTISYIITYIVYA